MEAAGIIALVRATTSTSLQARTLCLVWMNAPRDAFHLRGELDSCRGFFESIQAGIVESSVLGESPGERESGGVSNEQRASLRGLISKGAQFAQELGEILVKRLGQPVLEISSGGETRESQSTQEFQERLAFRKKILWLRRLDDVTRLRKMLRQTTHNIALCLTMMNLRITAVTAHSSEGNLRAFSDEFQTNIMTQMTENLETSRHEIESSLERSMMNLERSIQNQFARHLAASSHLGDDALETPEYGSAELASLSGDVVEQRKRGHSRESQAQTGGNTSPTTTVNRLRIPIADRLLCQCKYHSTARGSVSKWELSWVQHALSALGISWTGFTLTPSKDSDKGRQCFTCRGHQGHRKGYTRLMVQCNLPNWLTTGILSIYLSRHDSPELLIRVHRLIVMQSSSYPRDIISIVYANDAREFKSLLSSCPSSVHDIHAESRDSALLVAVNRMNVSAVELLLKAGADPLQENKSGATPARHALILFLAQAENPGSPTHKIAAMMPIFDFLEMDDFTDLHRVIIGWFPLDLQTALIKPAFRAHIGKTTSCGLTSLHFAARNCPSGNEVRLLLDAGEDPNAVAHACGGATPLSWAFRGGNRAGVKALLAAGASPEFSNNQDRTKDTLFHEAMASCRDTTDVLELLLEPELGLDINVPLIDGTTVVMIALVRSDLAALRYLVRKGADVDAKDNSGDTALRYAISHRFHDGVRLLVGLDSELGSVGGIERRYLYIDEKRGYGILHCVAIYGDTKTMDIMRSLKMVGLPDPNTFTDLEGKTALDHFNTRVGFEVGFGLGPDRSVEGSSSGVGGNEVDELIQAWKALLRSVNVDVREMTEGDGTSNTDEDGRDIRGVCNGDSDDEFFDAVEG